MFEEEIVVEMTSLIAHHMEHYAQDRPPKVTLRLPRSLKTDLALLLRLFQDHVQARFPAAITLCVDHQSAIMYCKDCGRQYRGSFLYDLCERCQGEHFEPDEHLQVSVEAFDRRAPHKRQIEKWQFSLPAY